MSPWLSFSPYVMLVMTSYYQSIEQYHTTAKISEAMMAIFADAVHSVARPQ